MLFLKQAVLVPIWSPPQPCQAENEQVVSLGCPDGRGPEVSAQHSSSHCLDTSDGVPDSSAVLRSLRLHPSLLCSSCSNVCPESLGMIRISLKDEPSALSETPCQKVQCGYESF